MEEISLEYDAVADRTDLRLPSYVYNLTILHYHVYNPLVAMKLTF